MPKYFEFKLPAKILSGAGALEHIAHELKGLGAHAPMLMSDAGLVRFGVAGQVKAAMEGSGCHPAAEFYDVPADSSIQVVNQAADLFRRSGCDSLVAVGGGSVLDTAKGVGMVLAQGTEDLRQNMGCEALPRGQHVPYVAIPTTAGTGSEATLVAVIADPDRQVKMEFISYHLLPDVAVLDPRMTRTLPPRVTAATGMDTLCHAVEAGSCLQRNPISDAFAEKAIGLVMAHLTDAVDDGDNLAARQGMANASLLAGAAFSNSMVGLVHAIGHALGGVCRVPHGEAMNILLPAVMRYNLPKCAERYGELLLPLAGPEIYAATPGPERPMGAIQAIEGVRGGLAQTCKLPARLRDTGKVQESDFDAVIARALNDGAIIVNPREAGANDIRALLQEVW